MGVDNRFEPLENGEVLSVEDTSQILIGHRTFRAGEFSEAIRAQLEYGLGGWTEEKDGWFSEYGISCEVLRFGAGNWTKGKVRIRLEFSPEPSDGSLPPQKSEAPRQQITPTPPLYEQEFELPELVTPVADEFELAQSSIGADDLDLTPTLDLDEQASSFSDDLILQESDLSFAEPSEESDEQKEGQDADSLLDDVWQDMNQASWHGN